jgi:hypothetical protein
MTTFLAAGTGYFSPALYRRQETKWPGLISANGGSFLAQSSTA